MQVYYSGMFGIPNISSNAQYFDILKKILNGELNQKADANNGNFLEFNAGCNINEDNLYVITDGAREIETKCKQINPNTIETISDISSLTGNIYIKYKKSHAWNVDGNTIFNNIIKITIVNNGYVLEHTNGGRYEATNNVTFSSVAEFYVTNDSFIFKIPAVSSDYHNRLRYIIRSNSGGYFHNANDGAGRLNAVNLLNQSNDLISVSEIKALGNAESIGRGRRGEQTRENIGFCGVWVRDEFIKYLLTSSTPIGVDLRDRTYFNNGHRVRVSNIYEHPTIETESFFFSVDLDYDN